MKEEEEIMKPPHKELVADGNRQKPPRMTRPAPSTTSSDALTALDDIDDDLTTSASESYVQDESSSDEGKTNKTEMTKILQNIRSQTESIKMSVQSTKFNSKMEQSINMQFCIPILLQNVQIFRSFPPNSLGNVFDVE